MSVVDFAEQDGIGNAMAMHLEGMKPEDFDLLLLSEDLVGSLKILNYVIGNMDIPQYFGHPIVLPRENTKAERTRTVEISQAQRSAIYLRSPRDNEIYRKAVELFEKRQAAIG